MVYHFGHDCDLPSITRCTFVIDPRTVRILEPYAWPKIKIENKKNYLSCEAPHHIHAQNALHWKPVHFALLLCDIFWMPIWEQTCIYILCIFPFLLSLCKDVFFSPLTYCHAYFMFFTVHVLLWEVIYIKEYA